MHITTPARKITDCTEPGEVAEEASSKVRGAAGALYRVFVYSTELISRGAGATDRKATSAQGQPPPTATKLLGLLGRPALRCNQRKSQAALKAAFEKRGRPRLPNEWGQLPAVSAAPLPVSLSPRLPARLPPASPSRLPSRVLRRVASILLSSFLRFYSARLPSPPLLFRSRIPPPRRAQRDARRTYLFQVSTTINRRGDR